MTPKQEHEATERLKQQRERERIESEAHRQSLAALVRLPEFQKHVLGTEGWLAAHEQQEMEALASEKLTPLDSHLALAVRLDRWRHLRALRQELAQMVDAPAPPVASP